MGLFSSIGRFFGTLFGIAQGSTERATDAMVSGSPDAIRSQFRKTKEDWTREYQEMRDAVAELIRIREMRLVEIKKLNSQSDELEQKMNGAITLYKKTPDERYKQAYGQIAAENEKVELRIKELMQEVDTQNSNIDRYKSRLMEFDKQIKELGQEEAETVADIVSSKKVKELNDRLSGLSNDTDGKNLEAIRSARHKAKAVAQLSNELSGIENSSLESELKAAGAGTKFDDVFDAAVSGKPQSANVDAPEQIAAKSSSTTSTQVVDVKDGVDADLEKLLQGVPKT